MKKTVVYMFTSPTCPHCHSARKFMQKFKQSRDDFSLKELSTATPKGRKQANKYGIMSVPTFIIEGPNYPQPIGLRGVQSEKAMNKYLDMSYGIEKQDKPKRGLKLGRFKLSF